MDLVRWITCALILAAASPEIAPAAPGVIDLSWGNCSPVVADVASGTQTASLIASVLGNDETHVAYQVRFLMADATRHVPDAWRFDAAGCQGSSLVTMNHIPVGALAKTCPAFQGIGASIQIRDYDFVPPGSQLLKSEIRGVLANTYPSGMTSVATQRYFLAEFLFDHQFSAEGPGTPGVTCGGLETPMCFVLFWGPPEIHGSAGTSSFIRQSDGVELYFQPGNIAVTVNGFHGCPYVPAARSTWGQVKGAYRR